MENYLTTEDLKIFRNILLNDIEKLLQSNTPSKIRQEDNNELNAEWLRSKDVRKILNVSAGTLQNLRIKGTIRYKKIMGSYYYNKSDLLNLFNEH